MSGIINGTVTLSSSGTQDVVVGVQPIAIECIVTSKGGESYSHHSVGFCDNTYFTTYNTNFQDGTGGKSDQGSGTNGKVVSVYERVSGTLTEVLSASVTSFSATKVRFNVTNPNANYTVNLVVWY